MMATRNARGGWDLTDDDVADVMEKSGWDPWMKIPLSVLFDEDHHDTQRGIHLYACIICGRITPNRVTHLQAEHGAANAD